MKALVTGGAGFVGSHLVDKLYELGHEVEVWDSYTTGKKENHNRAGAESGKVNYYDISVEDIDPAIVAPHDCEVIFHLAGEARIQPSFEKPLTVHDSNVTGTIKVLEYARLCKARFVFAGSSSVYNDMYANPYSFSKQVAEYYCTLYNKIYGLSVAIARFFNVYGPRHLEEGAYATVIGVFEKQYREGRLLTITGSGEQRRDFTHVRDIVNGLEVMGRSPWQAEIFNLGTGKNHSINEVAAMFGGPTVYVPKRPGEAWTTLADIAKSREKLAYEPIHSLEDYIKGVKARNEHLSC